MNAFKYTAALAVLSLAAAGCATGGGHDPSPAMAKAKSPYTLVGDQVEGCECTSVCPCVFAHDVTFADCRGTMAWHIQDGNYGATDLSGINFALVLTKSGRTSQDDGEVGRRDLRLEQYLGRSKRREVTMLSTNWDEPSRGRRAEKADRVPQGRRAV
jgi:hypothetical protein